MHIPKYIVCTYVKVTVSLYVTDFLGIIEKKKNILNVMSKVIWLDEMRFFLGLRC